MKKIAIATVAKIASALVCLMLVSAPAGAQIISVYSDTWASFNEGDESLTTYAYGDADSDGESGRLDISIVIYDPSWNILVTDGAHTQSGFVSTQTSTNITTNSPEGSYHVEAAADWQFSHYDCSTQVIDIGKYASHYNYYQKEGPWFHYVLAADSASRHCSHLGQIWGYYEPPGLTDKGYYFMVVNGSGTCIGHCVAGKTTPVSGPAGAVANSLPTC